MLDYRLIGARIREKRRESNITQETLGELSNLSPVYISNIENARKRPSLETMVSISNALGVTVDELLTGHQKHDFAEYMSDIQMIMADCNPQERRFVFELVRYSRYILQQNNWMLTKINSENSSSF